MSRPLQRLRERKLFQWGVAYLAGAWLLLQVLDLLSATYGWPAFVMRSMPVLLVAGFFATLVLAWYHGEQGRQRVTGPELLALTSILLVAGLAVAWVQRDPGTEPVVVAGTTVDPRSVAVLPFDDPTVDTEGPDYFGEGVAEEILDALARVPGIRVAARTSAFNLRERGAPVPDIARELGVATVLAGSVRRSGDRLRVTARLLDAAGTVLWSQSFDGTPEDVFAVQGEIAQSVAGALRVQLGSGAGGSTTLELPSATAHDLFLQGLFYWNRRTTLHLRRAIDLFDQALRIEPNYARAHAGLALAWSVIHLNAPEIRPAEALARAESAARRALELDPQLAEAYTALGYTYHWLWRTDEALEALERAVALNPNSSGARQWYGEVLAQSGRSAEAEAQLRHAVALDPLSLAAHGNLGLVLLFSGRTRDALAQIHATLRMDPAFAFPLLLLHRVALHLGDFDEARSTGRRWAEVTGDVNAEDLVTLVDAIEDPARRSAGEAVLARWRRSAAPPWIDVAFYHMLLGDRESSLEALERAYVERLPFLRTVGRSPIWDPLAEEPRFREIVEAVWPPAPAVR